GSGYEEMNRMAMEVPPGSQGLIVLPFGNGAERILENRDIGCRILGMNFNLHTRAHLLRASQEGIAFALRYGLAVMKQNGIAPAVIRAGCANMFLSPLFRQILADVSDTTIELYDTDGSMGAAIGAAVGDRIGTAGEILGRLKKKMIVEPSSDNKSMMDAYLHWKNCLDKEIIH
ncbi:MAG TPA: FGGY-family carbohydrate kinase, partial [Bacteroidales bacterium]|nr:FGGY-family carbohydrate kinase [Bacteroidales bacterium]